MELVGLYMVAKIQSYHAEDFEKCIRFVEGLLEYYDDLGDTIIRFNHVVVLGNLMLQ